MYMTGDDAEGAAPGRRRPVARCRSAPSWPSPSPPAPRCCSAVLPGLLDDVTDDAVPVLDAPDAG